LLKARNATRHTGCPPSPTIPASRDYLNGAPGIYSARYAGKNASDEQNSRKLLDDLVGIPETERTARFQCLMVYLRHEFDPTPIICQWRGKDAYCPQPRGAMDSVTIRSSCRRTTVRRPSCLRRKKLSHGGRR
jgi:XTP/dITP diphosphohydrolase